MRGDELASGMLEGACHDHWLQGRWAKSVLGRSRYPPDAIFPRFSDERPRERPRTRALHWACSVPVAASRAAVPRRSQPATKTNPLLTQSTPELTLKLNKSSLAGNVGMEGELGARDRLAMGEAASYKYQALVILQSRGQISPCLPWRPPRLLYPRPMMEFIPKPPLRSCNAVLWHIEV